jgi:hypothetical protein
VEISFGNMKMKKGWTKKIGSNIMIQYSEKENRFLSQEGIRILFSFLKATGIILGNGCNYRTKLKIKS